MPLDWKSSPLCGRSLTPSLYQETWASGSESSHCSAIGEPASMDLFLSSSGRMENLTGGAICVLVQHYLVNFRDLEVQDSIVGHTHLILINRNANECY